MVSYPKTHDVDEGDISLGNDAASIAHDFKEKLFFELAKFPGVATMRALRISPSSPTRAWPSPWPCCPAISSSCW